MKGYPSMTHPDKPNETIKGLFERKSVRVFTKKPIESQIKELIFRAAEQAPTAGNQQLYTILDITDQTLKDRLAETCDHQPFIAQAPMVLIFCADVQKWYDAFVFSGCSPRNPGEGDFMLAVCDAVIAAQNAVTAAESLGIGSCYIGDIMEQCEIHRNLLNLPPLTFPAAMVVFGYPTEQQKQRKKPVRCDLSYIVRENRYHRMDETELNNMLQKNCPNGDIKSWIQAFCTRKYNSDFSKEMSRSVGEYLKNFK